MDNVKTDTARNLISTDEEEFKTDTARNLISIDEGELIKTDTARNLISTDEADSASTFTMILVGKSQSGISTIAKMFNKYKNFEPYSNLSCGISTGYVNSKRTTLVDIPGFFGIDDEQKKPGIILQSYTRSITTDIILFVVLRVGSVTKYDMKVFNLIRNLNNRRKILQNIVIFTCNESDAEGFSVDNFIQQSPKLSDFISSYNCKSCVFHFSTKWESENAERFFSSVDLLIAKANTFNENTTIMNEIFDKVDQGKVEKMAKHCQSCPHPPKEPTNHTLFRKRTVSHSEIFDKLSVKQPECFGPVPLKQQDEQSLKRRTECCSRCTLL